MAKDLKKRGFSFVGPTTVYAFMQAMGLVNDHLEGCYVREPAEAARAGLEPPRQEPAVIELRAGRFAADLVPEIGGSSRPSGSTAST